MAPLPPSLQRNSVTMPKQLYGWTEMVQPPAGKYVSFIAASENSDGSITFTIRNDAGVHNSITLPAEAATEMCLAVMLSGRCREIAHAKIPKPEEPES